jgi:hypothetical protein
MEPLKIEIPGTKVKLDIDFKGGRKTIIDNVPDIGEILKIMSQKEKEDFYRQYIGIWKIFFSIVFEWNAKKVLEFGTREGYSTRLFSKALEKTEGQIITVDINKPNTPFTESNIITINSDVESLLYQEQVDILYIDDWHDPWHLYYELNKFAHLAKVVIIHDVCIEQGYPKSLTRSIEEWCRSNMIIYTIYPMNECGLAVLEIEKSLKFY